MKTRAVIFVIALFTTAFQSPVPVASEGHHHLKFENKYVRVFDVVVAPGDETLYHVHSNDYVFVSIGDATLKAQVSGAQRADLILKDGETRYTKGPITHRVINIGKTPFHNLTIEVLVSPGIKEEGTPLKEVPGHSVILENDKVRIEHFVLEPGQSTGLHTHSLMRLSVAVTAARLAVYSPPGSALQVIESQPGVFNWHDEKRTHSLANIGNTRYESIEIEWK